MNKYAVIYASRLTNEHIALVRATGMNSTADSLKRSSVGYEPEMVIVEWDDTIAQQIPEAVIAIQEMLDEQVIIRTESEMREYLADPNNPFYEEPV
jgi:hypothetical protein